jgi:IS1 family transposase
MYLDENNPERLRWRCNGIVDALTGIQCCRGRSRTYRVDSFFAGRGTKPENVMLVLYFWAIRVRKSEIVKLTHLDPKTVAKIISDWYQMIQEDISEENCTIGGYDSNGERIVVEIDESKFGKRKYYRGHHVEGVWVVGGVEKTKERKCFLMVVPDRSQVTLTAIIERYVKRGSIVRTDCWRAYNNMVNLGHDLVHQTVNHSVEFINGDVHTNTIEGNKFIEKNILLSLH